MIAEELGIAHGTVFAWAKRYREDGEEGLRSQVRGKRKSNVSTPAKEKAIEMKKANPEPDARRSLSGGTPCMAFFGPENKMKQFTKRRRKEVYETIIEMSAAIMAASEDVRKVDSAWRLAVEMWLLDNRFITMSKKRECYPLLEKLFVHH